MKTNKKGKIGLAVIMLSIAFCGALYQYQIPGTTGDSTKSVTEIADINTTPCPNNELNETCNTTNQSAFTVPLEKPPFI